MEILQFTGKKFFTIEGIDEKNKITLELHSFKGKKVDSLVEEDAQNIINSLQQNNSPVKAILKEVKQKKMKITPPAPFTTASLQQEAPSLGLSIGEVSKISQNLYEDGLITYIRTDSVRLSEEIMVELEKYIKSNYTDLYEKRIFKNKTKNTQEAHECIRPTDITKDVNTPLYNVIKLRTIASQTKQAIRVTNTHYYAIEDALFKINDTYLEYMGFYTILGTNLSNQPVKLPNELELSFTMTEHENSTTSLSF
jgi:DNA topoisomerase-1